jgi:hypothetical protein
VVNVEGLVWSELACRRLLLWVGSGSESESE